VLCKGSVSNPMSAIAAPATKRRAGPICEPRPTAAPKCNPAAKIISRMPERTKFATCAQP
jgi:hypothetical protein